MKQKWIMVPILLGCITMVLSWVLTDMGGLADFICSSLGLLMFGISAALAAIILGKNNGKRDYKFTIGITVLACLFLLIGSKNLIYAGLDSLKGTKEVILKEYSVSKTVSLRRIFRSYYLEGMDESNIRRTFTIDKDTYQMCEENHQDFLEVIFWEYTGVMKKIK